MTIAEQVKGFTVIESGSIDLLVKYVRQIVTDGVLGPMAECGVYRGGCVMAMAYALMELGQHRDLYLFDTFSGMTKPEEIDGVWPNQLWETERDWCYASLKDVQANLASTGYPPEKLHYVVGPVEQTLPEQAPESLSLLRLDSDWYSSTRQELAHLFPRLSSGGILIIDDYHHWEGCRKAVDEYFDSVGITFDKIPGAGHQVIIQK